MSEDISICKKDLVYPAPAAGAVTTQRDVEFRGADGASLTMDVYAPAMATSAQLPAVVLVAGYPDDGFQRVAGCRFKEMQSTVSWARLIGASGLRAITYTNRDPANDAFAVVRAVRETTDRIGIWSTSGNAPVALSVLMRDSPERVTCAVFAYPYLLDLDGDTAIADAQRSFRFANPGAGRSLDDLRVDVPLLVARAGQDQTPRLNESLDRFVAHALRGNLPVSLVNHPEGPHAFDLFHDSETSRAIVREILAFLSGRAGGSRAVGQ
jgi:hypothetical protein